MKNNALSSIDEIIDEAKNGRMFILVDDEDRENEGDLVIPAQMATPEAINFMAREGRGLICLSMLKSRIEELGLDLMSRDNRSAYETAFTVSIEAREGVTTGISAADRARTVAVAINSANGAEAIVTPGHVFPLVARDGGVLVRAGHTEAAVDIARLAGLNPSGVICEIMNEDGTMARMDDLVAFAQRHNLRIGTIRDLIAYRLRRDHNLRKVGEARFQSMFGGDWTAVTFRNKAVDSEMLALVKGHVDPDQPTLVRMHVVDVFTDMLGVAGERHGLLQSAMAEIAREGAGVIVMITQQMPNMLTRFVARKSDESPAVSDLDALRDYGVGAQILSALGVHDMILLTNSPRTLVALQGFALDVVGHRAMTSTPPSTWIQ
ncbi:MAG: 3,4-dihydroxy-2-butanone-4-phosphate synthase [Sphingomonas bacterium]|uniref:3,4-dihydroxy-2-butanone-4-phosphate synthase n=1 Tax=Sphingomonas bacterium TaxID=1895847 RepID=UPI0026260F18|nr:3,4-dihydroxy-2-butanone-4-phosphate synthase [Sphingomonas bacterium]MDB5707737.1 3,4-dihydroxy-2-butanone-4-phosphate synthase [Sphingomonas bacterium]